MSYQVLARKWRPRDFDGVVGQEHVVRALRHALREKRLHHAYLFTGTRGVGKTTLSRILAKSLNCVGPDGHGDVTDTPCGVCEACRAIDEGRFVDYIEMDAASNRGVDEMTALLEQAMYPPTNARFKVYMIDEVHQLTNTAFNAMLKTLEEPPEYVKFILATTDPQKVPVTVLSRCLQFSLRNMTPEEVASHMERILQVEKLEAEPAALRLLAAGARGSMRDGLSLLDQAIAFSDGRVTLEAVRSMLGVADSSVLYGLLDALCAGSAAGMIAVADEIGLHSYSYGQALRDLAGILHKTAMMQRVPAALAGDPDRDRIAALAAAFAPDEVQLYYQIAIHGRNDLHLAPDEYAGFTMALLRMLAFKPAGSRVTVSREVPEKVPAAAAEPVQKKTALTPQTLPEPKPQTEQKAPAPVRAQQPAEPEAAPVKAEPAAAPSDVPEDPFLGTPSKPPRAAVKTAEPEKKSAPARKTPRVLKEFPGSWRALVDAAALDGPEGQSAKRSECVSLTEHEAVLRTPNRIFATAAVKRNLEKAFAAVLGHPFTVLFEQGETQSETVYAAEKKEEAEDRRKLIAAYKADPLVKNVIAEFGGAVAENSVEKTE